MRTTVRGIRRRLTKRQPTKTGFTTIDDGIEIADIELVIDDEALASLMGRRAMKAKRLVSQLAHGAIKARALNIRRAS